MTDLSALNREELMDYMAEAHNQLIHAENLTKKYNNLKSQIRNTIGKHDKLKADIADSIEFGKDFARQTGYTNATDLGSLANNAVKTASFAGIKFFFNNLNRIAKRFTSGCLMTIIAIIAFRLLNPLLSKIMSESTFGAISVITVFVTFFILPGVIFGKKEKKELAQQNRQILEDNVYFTNEANKLDREIQIARNRWNNDFPEFPQKYAYSYATDYFYNALESYRADNIKELINSFEESLYRERMLSAQNQILQEQRRNNILAEQNLYVNLANLNELRNQTHVIQDEARSTRERISQEYNKTRKHISDEARQTRSKIDDYFRK